VLKTKFRRTDDHLRLIEANLGDVSVCVTVFFGDRRPWHQNGVGLAGVEKSIADYLCGHTDYSAGAGYVHGVSVSALHEAVENVKFDGFNV
jgi:hypothetical protein